VTHLRKMMLEELQRRNYSEITTRMSRQLLACSSATEPRLGSHDVCSVNADLWHCPRCGASMIVIQRFTAEELSACTYFDSS
jgi:hypothetical protein